MGNTLHRRSTRRKHPCSSYWSVLAPFLHRATCSGKVFSPRSRANSARGLRNASSTASTIFFQRTVVTLSVASTPASTSPSEPAAAITEPRYFTFTESRHAVVVRAGTHSAERAARHVDRVPPRIAPAGACDGDRAPEPGIASASSSSFCLAVPVVARARSRELSADRGKGGGGVAESLARPETGRVGV